MQKEQTQAASGLQIRPVWVDVCVSFVKGSVHLSDHILVFPVKQTLVLVEHSTSELLRQIPSNP